MVSDDTTAWAAFAFSALMLAAYEARVLWIGRARPWSMARYAHAQLRMRWVAALSQPPGFEIVAVQVLRNSLMSATIAASTAALALMGLVSLAGATVASGIAELGLESDLPLRALLEGLLMLVLFASYVCSALAMRYFNHAGFVMSMPAASTDRQALTSMATDYVVRAGLLYGWGLRCFLMIAPLVAEVVSPLAMVPAHPRVRALDL